MTSTDKISKAVSHALRHDPSFYNLILDNEGWVNISDLIESMKCKGYEIDETTVFSIANNSEKKRHEILGSRIRAIYGHSIKEKITKNPEIPPDILYHGTPSKNLINIFHNGLLPMERQYVHLSSDPEMAINVALRKSKDVSVIKVQSKEASISNILFYKEVNSIWLSEKIPPSFVSL